MKISNQQSINLRRGVWWGIAGITVLLLIIHIFYRDLHAFPESWNLGLREPIDEFKTWAVVNRRSHPFFVYLIEPLKDNIDYSLRLVEDFLLWLPWTVIVAFVFLLAQKISGLRLALLTSACLLLMGLLGLWDRSLQTLSLMVIAVAISLLIGIPLGIWTARNDRAEKILRPILDAMQTMPAFVYLIPVLIFFGVARVPSIIATIVYALPPAIRLTNLGIRQVAPEILEAAHAFGATPRQVLYKVQIPLAIPSIMAGVNQTIMMALSIVVIAALIGSGGLGESVLKALRGLKVGQAMEAGLAIVFLAVLMDRLSQAFIEVSWSSQENFQGFRFFPESKQDNRSILFIERGIDTFYRLGDVIQRGVSRVIAGILPQRYKLSISSHSYLLTSILFLVLLFVTAYSLQNTTTLLYEFPTNWYLGLRDYIDTGVNWAQHHLVIIDGNNIELGISHWWDSFTIHLWLPLTKLLQKCSSCPDLGTGPLSDFLTIYILLPLQKFLQEQFIWPIFVVFIFASSLYLTHWRLAFSLTISTLFIGLLGMWELAMDTLSQVIVAVLLSIVIGIPFGIGSACNDFIRRLLRPVLDFLQTIPTFCFLVPVIMLFSIGRISGVIASILYALPPVIRLTDLGIRQVQATTVEAAFAFGSTPWQTLTKVQIPLALPAIMLGINQTIMMVLAMVIIAGLVGGGGLGLEVVTGLAQNDLGQSVEAGLAIVLIAIVIDRLSQAWAEKQAKQTNLAF